jgi:hypothetical protein
MTTGGSEAAFADFSPAPNQGGRPDLYELENRAIDPDGVLLEAMRALAPWAGRTLVDLGCGASRKEVMSRWEFTSRADFEAVLRLEFPAVADAWLASHPDALGLSYGYVLFAAGREGDTTAVRDKGG